MFALNWRKEQRSAVSSALLTPKRITALTDAASKLFDVFYDIEKQQREAAKPRLAAELDRLDLFGPGEHYSCHEDYRLSDGGLG
jgi:hypothetical protein